MKLPKLTNPIGGTTFATSAEWGLQGLQPAQTSIPTAIAGKLASDYAINEVTGLAQCVGVLSGILDNYQRCVDAGRNGCEIIAARNIAQLACRSYCTCN